MLVDCYGGRRRRYWCAARDSLVRAMEDHLRHLGRTGDQPLPVARVGTWEVIFFLSFSPEVEIKPQGKKKRVING